MALFHRVRLQVSQLGWLPRSRLALITSYLLALDIFLFLLQKAFGAFHSSLAKGLSGWVSGLSAAVILLLIVLALRWAKARLLWRLRNRLIVTYIFIGVIPVILLVALAAGSFYLFAGQFATFIVTSELDAELRSLQATTSATANDIADELKTTSPSRIASVYSAEKLPANRQTYAWLGKNVILGIAASATVPSLPSRAPFRGLVRDRGELFLRCVQQVPAGNAALTVFSSEPFDQSLLQHLASNLGAVVLYTSGTTMASDHGNALGASNDLSPAAYAGTLPPAAHRFDMQVSFPTGVSVLDWNTGITSNLAAISVQTRLSKLYERLFASLGAFAPAVEFSLLLVAVVFAIIELIALLIGIRLNRTVTGAVAGLYDATLHINRGNFSHRIPVRSSDQLATLATSFNSMTASLEKLLVEQKEKQRMQNELVIAQEVQAQLFPRHISQLPSLEVFGFCRPARTVSGDYYDFLTMEPGKLMLAIGDISGKGISAALLMATVHSAVRAYSLEGIPIFRESTSIGAGALTGSSFPSTLQGVEVSPAALLTLLNRQLFESTPAEKYATLFLGIYDEQERRLTYCNGGHLPPVILDGNGNVRRLDQGGSVVGLFDRQVYDEATVQLYRGEILLGYSDGVTEPESDFGEFGEERLIELVQENRDLPLARISELVTAAVDDWIGANEQPDDLTLVLARAR